MVVQSSKCVTVVYIDILGLEIQDNPESKRLYSWWLSGFQLMLTFYNNVKQIYFLKSEYNFFLVIVIKLFFSNMLSHCFVPIPHTGVGSSSLPCIVVLWNNNLFD